MKIDLKKLSLDELKALQKDVAKSITSYEKRAKAEAKAKLEKVAKDMGFKLSELLDDAPARKARPKSKGVAKYAHPENPEMTWTGRGRRPKWVEEALAGGKKLEDLAI